MPSAFTRFLGMFLVTFSMSSVTTCHVLTGNMVANHSSNLSWENATYLQCSWIRNQGYSPVVTLEVRADTTLMVLAWTFGTVFKPKEIGHSHRFLILLKDHAFHHQ